MNNAYLKEIHDWEMPIRRLDDTMNPFAESKVVLWALCGFQSGNYITMKAGMVERLLTSALEAGITKNLRGIVEATSGATGLVITQLARDRIFQMPNVEITLVVNKGIPDGKRLPLHYAGAKIIEPEEGLTAIGTARKMGGGGWSKESWEPSENGYLNLDQYANPANWIAYQDVVAPRVLRKMEPHGFRLFVCPIGTGGTIVGLSEGFRKERNDISIVGAMNVPGETIPGMRSVAQMSEIKFPWREAADKLIEVTSLHAHIAALQIDYYTGIMMGISSGAAYIATLSALKEHQEKGTLDSLRSPDGYVHAMFVAHDGLRTYTANAMPILDVCNWREKMVWELLWQD